MSISCRNLSAAFFGSSWTLLFTQSINTNHINVQIKANQTSSSSPSLAVSNLNQFISNYFQKINVVNREVLESFCNHLQSPDFEIKSLNIVTENHGHLHLLSKGEAQIIIQRNDTISTLTKTSSYETSYLQGEIYEQDLLLLTDSTDYKPALVSSDASKVEEFLLPLLPKHPFVALLTYTKSIKTTNFLNAKRKISLPRYIFFLIPILIILATMLLKNLNTSFNYDSSKKQLDDLLVKAEGINPINPVSAKQTAKEAQEILVKLQKVKQESWQDNYLSRLEKILDTYSILPTSQPIPSQTSQLDSSKSSGNIGQAQPFLDLSLINKNANYSRLAFQKDSLVLLDSSNKRLDRINLESKNISNLSQSASLESAQILYTTQADIYTANSQSLYKTDSNGNQVKLINFSTQGNTISANQISFWNGALYLLDTQARQIYRYSPNTVSFDQPQLWLKSQSQLASDTLSISIDTNLYTLSRTNLVSLYSKGEKTNFTLTGISESLTPVELLVPVGSSKIFILTSGKIYVFTKSGAFEKVYSLGDAILQSATVIGNSIYILTGDQKIIKLSNV